MNDILANILVFLTLAILAGAVFLILRRRGAARQAELASWAASRGWMLKTVREPLAWGLRLAGPGWELEALSRSSGKESGPGSSDVRMQTAWQSRRGGGSPFMIGPRLSAPAALASFAEPLAQVFTGGKMSEVSLPPALQSKYLLLAEDPGAVQHLLTPELTSLLLGWKNAAPHIRRDASGLQIVLQGERLKTATALEAMIALGQALLESS